MIIHIPGLFPWNFLLWPSEVHHSKKEMWPVIWIQLYMVKLNTEHGNVRTCSKILAENLQVLEKLIATNTTKSVLIRLFASIGLHLRQTAGNNLLGFALHFAIQISYTCYANLSSVAYNSDAAVATMAHFLVKSPAVLAMVSGQRRYDKVTSELKITLEECN